MTNTQQLTQGKNTVQVVGVLAKNNLKQGTVKQGKNKGKKYINGSIEVKVSDHESHTLNFFEMETFNSGAKNNAYNNLLVTLQGHNISIADIASGDAPEGAKPTVVRVSGGQLESNDYYSTKINQLKSEPQVTGRYISQVKPKMDGTMEKFGSRFQVEGVIDKIQELEETDGSMYVRLLVLNFDFRGNVVPLELTVRGTGAEFVAGNATKGDAFAFHGELRNVFERKEEVVEMDGGFGEPTVKVSQIFIREWLVKGGKPLTSGHNYDNTELIEKAKAEREKYLASLEEKAKATKPTPKADNNLFSEPEDNKKEVEAGGLDMSDMESLFGDM